MKVKTLSRRLSELERNLHARAIQSKEWEENDREIGLYMRTIEQLRKNLANMTDQEKKEFAQQINRDARTMPLAPELEMYRDAFRKSTLRNLGLYDPFYGVVTLPETCKEVVK